MAEWAIVAAMVGGTAMSAISQAKQAKESRALYQQRAAVAEEGAEAVTKATEHEQRKKRMEGRRYVARQKVLFSKSGVKLIGTPLLVMRETAEEFEKEAAFIQEGGAVEARRLRSEAGLERQAGASAYRAGMWGAGTTVMTGLGTVGMYGYQRGWLGKSRTPTSRKDWRKFRGVI